MRHATNTKRRVSAAVALIATLGLTACGTTRTHVIVAAPASTLPTTPPPSNYAHAVWVLPTFTTGYVPGRAESDGTYIGGHTQDTVVEAGHWASQEEAELQGKPYVNPTSSEVITPRHGARASVGRREVALHTETKTVETKTVVKAETKKSPAVAAALARSKDPAVTQNAVKTTTTAVVQTPAAPAAATVTTVTTTQSAGGGGFKIEQPNENEVVVFGGAAGQTYDVPVKSGKTIKVHYVTETQVELSNGVSSHTVTLPRPGAKMKVSAN